MARQSRRNAHSRMVILRVQAEGKRSAMAYNIRLKLWRMFQIILMFFLFYDGWHSRRKPEAGGPGAELFFDTFRDPAAPGGAQAGVNLEFG